VPTTSFLSEQNNIDYLIEIIRLKKGLLSATLVTSHQWALRPCCHYNLIMLK